MESLLLTVSFYAESAFLTSRLWLHGLGTGCSLGFACLEDKVFPIHAEARSLPYANEFFDLALSVDAYHYFGTDEYYLNNYLALLVKANGQIAIAIPGVTDDYDKSTVKEHIEKRIGNNTS